jgi:hypothetical protein
LTVEELVLDEVALIYKVFSKIIDVFQLFLILRVNLQPPSIFLFFDVGLQIILSFNFLFTFQIYLKIRLANNFTFSILGIIQNKNKFVIILFVHAMEFFTIFNFYFSLNF